MRERTASAGADGLRAVPIRVLLSYGGGVARRLTPLLALLVVGCGPLSDGPVAWQGRVDTVGSRVVVRNPAEPLLRGEGAFVRELWSRPLGWNYEDRRLWEPGPQVRAAGGSVYVLDPVHETVEVLDAADGGQVGSIDPAAGPDVDSLAGSHALAVTGGSVVVADTSTVTVLAGTNGTPLGHHSFDANVIDVYGAGAGAFLVFAYGPSGPRWRFFGAADSVGEAYRPPVTRSETHPEAARSECWKVEGLPDGLLLLSCAHPVLLRFDRASDLLREIAFNRPPAEPSVEQVAAVRRAARQWAKHRRPDVGEEMLGRMAEAEVRRHPLVKKHFASRYDSSTTRVAVLEQTPAYMGGGNASLLLFSEEGRHLATLSFERQWLSFDFRDGILYAVTRQEGSLTPVLVAYELTIERESGS